VCQQPGATGLVRHLLTVLRVHMEDPLAELGDEHHGAHPGKH
jgi:hypothetical protein